MSESISPEFAWARSGINAEAAWDIPSYDLIGLCRKILDRPLSRYLQDKDCGPIYDKLKEIRTYHK